MFTNITLIILCLYAVFTPFIYIKFINIGIMLGSSGTKEIPKPKKKKKSKKPEMSEEEKQMVADFNAINNYDGF